jgi:ANTAR domain-containing protein
MLPDLESTPEQVLEKGLASLESAAAELEASAVAVLVREGARVQIAYPVNSEIACGEEALAGLHDGDSERAAAETPLAQFLKSTLGTAANSFLLFPWQARRRTVIIVFGFDDTYPRHSAIPLAVAETLKLAALAAWSVNEARCLRAELRVLNLRVAGRKLVERAKGVLQAEKGITEQQAYECLRRMSRQRRVTMEEAAGDLLRSAARPT